MIAMCGPASPTPATRPPRGRLAMKQAKIRRRRHGHLPVVNDGDWSLRREIADVAGPLAVQVAARLNPLQFRRPILAYADAAHEAAGTSPAGSRSVMLAPRQRIWPVTRASAVRQ